MRNRVWTIGAAVIIVVSIVALFMVRPELATNPNIWAILVPVIPALIALYKAEEGSKKAEQSLDETVETRRELKNGTMTKVVQDAVMAVLEKHGVQVTSGKEKKDDA